MRCVLELWARLKVQLLNWFLLLSLRLLFASSTVVGKGGGGILKSALSQLRAPPTSRIEVDFNLPTTIYMRKIETEKTQVFDLEFEK